MKKDLQKKGYFYDPERFADLIAQHMKTNELMQVSNDAAELYVQKYW